MWPTDGPRSPRARHKQREQSDHEAAWSVEPPLVFPVVRDARERLEQEDPHQRSSEEADYAVGRDRLRPQPDPRHDDEGRDDEKEDHAAAAARRMLADVDCSMSPCGG